MKLWHSVVFWLGILAVVMVLEATGLACGVPDQVIAAAIVVVLGGFIVIMRKRARR